MAVFPVQLLVFKHEQSPQGERQDGGKEHEGGADAHAFDVAGAFGGGEEAGPEEGAALADYVDEDEGAAAAGVAALVVWGGCVLVLAYYGIRGRWRGLGRENVLIVQARMFGIVENTPADARNVAKYRTPTVLTVARMM